MFNCQLDLLLEEIIHFGSEVAALGKETCLLLTVLGHPNYTALSTQPKTLSCDPQRSPLLKKKGTRLHPFDEGN